MLTGSLSGPGGVNVAFQPVGNPLYRGLDSYTASNGTITGSKDGDIYQCTPSNGVSSVPPSASSSIRGRDYIYSTFFLTKQFKIIIMMSKNITIYYHIYERYV